MREATGAIAPLSPDNNISDSIQIDNDALPLTETYSILTDKNVSDTVQMWLSDRDTAEERHGPIGSWDTSHVTNMKRLFGGASSFNDDISSWDVSSVTNMAEMFHQAKQFNRDLSKWDVSHVKDIHWMFSHANSFNGDISTWDVSSVTNMASTFSFASSFNSDISSWDVSSVTNMSGLFNRAARFDQDISRWDVSSVTTMMNMFNGASRFNRDVSNWDVTSVKSINHIFYNASSFCQALCWELGKQLYIQDALHLTKGASFGCDKVNCGDGQTDKTKNEASNGDQTNKHKIKSVYGMADNRPAVVDHTNHLVDGDAGTDNAKSAAAKTAERPGNLHKDASVTDSEIAEGVSSNSQDPHKFPVKATSDVEGRPLATVALVNGQSKSHHRPTNDNDTIHDTNDLVSSIAEVNGSGDPSTINTESPSSSLTGPIFSMVGFVLLCACCYLLLPGRRRRRFSVSYTDLSTSAAAKREGSAEWESKTI